MTYANPIGVACAPVAPEPIRARKRAWRRAWLAGMGDEWRRAWNRAKMRRYRRNLVRRALLASASTAVDAPSRRRAGRVLEAWGARRRRVRRDARRRERARAAEAHPVGCPCYDCLWGPSTYVPRVARAPYQAVSGEPK